MGWCIFSVVLEIDLRSNSLAGVSILRDPVYVEGWYRRVRPEETEFSEVDVPNLFVKVQSTRIKFF